MWLLTKSVAWVLLLLFVFSSLSCSPVSAQDSVHGILFGEDGLSLIRAMCDHGGFLRSDFLNESLNLQFYAPSDQAVRATDWWPLFGTGISTNPDLWRQHLRFVCETHLNPTQNITSPISKQIEATNGVVYILEEALPLHLEPFTRLDLHKPYNGTFSDAITAINTSTEILETKRTSGTTFLGCSSDSLASEEPLVFDEQRLLYNLLPNNYYSQQAEDIEADQQLVMPLTGCAHMWVSSLNGRLCFNDACITSETTQQYLATTGVGYILNRCLPSCPGVGLLAQYAAKTTDYKVKRLEGLLRASGLNLRHLTDGRHGVTLLAPIDSTFDSIFNQASDVEQLLINPIWAGHARALVQGCCIIDQPLNQTELQIKAESGNTSLTMISGDVVQVGYNGGALTIDNLRIYFGDVFGVDGFLHFTAGVPWPPSFRLTAYTYARSNPRFSVHADYVDAAILKRINIQRPITVLYVPNEAFEDVRLGITTEFIVDLVRNHIFDANLSCEDFRQMALSSQRVQSSNGAIWRVKVANETSNPCFDVLVGDQYSKACITKCDVYVKNGIVHELDSIMLDETPGPTATPTITPAPTTSASPTVVASVAPSAAPTNGPTAYSERNRPTSTPTAAPTSAGTTAVSPLTRNWSLLMTVVVVMWSTMY